ncbi:MAG TPA: TIGR02996 domain-containing protein [Gemmataceae bacterium]|nr:TIGR02996 domain-containing protein [Gemmataceae bacterium]
MAISSPLDGAAINPEMWSFFHAIKENPDDDTPRLIFADWLQERGYGADAARGEYLRLCVLRRRLSPDDPSYSVLKRREGELFTEHRWTWLGPLVDAARKWTFERGMIQIEAQAEKLVTPEVRAWAQTSAALWVDALTLSELDHPHILHLAYSPQLAPLNALDLSGNANETGFRLLIRALRPQRLCFLRQLSLQRCRLSAYHIHSLARWPELRRLTVLDLRRNRLDDTAARRLAESPHLQSLTTLHLGRNRFTAEGMALLREAFGDRVHF